MQAGCRLGAVSEDGGWRGDIDRAAEAGLRHVRLDLDWARLEPSQGVYSASATLACREALAYAADKGLTPLVTLLSHDCPAWLAERGGFTKPGHVAFFLDYVAYVLTHLGALADEYLTVDGPNRLADGQPSLRLACQVMSVLAACHMEAYALIHALREDGGFLDTRVGFVHHARVFAPGRESSPRHWLCAKLAGYLRQGAMARACFSGWFDFPFKNYTTLGTGLYADFIALSYGGRVAVTGLRGGPDGAAYPEGVVPCARELHDMLPLPIYMMGGDENGALAASGLPVERLYMTTYVEEE